MTLTRRGRRAVAALFVTVALATHALIGSRPMLAHAAPTSPQLTTPIGSTMINNAWVHTQPNALTSTRYGIIYNGTEVILDCYRRGQFYGTNDVWYFVRSSYIDGYVPSRWVNTIWDPVFGVYQCTY